MAEQKTNVMRLLEQKKISYRAHGYPHGDEAVDGVTVAGLIGVAPEQVFKTLVTRGASKCLYVFVIPVAEELEGQVNRVPVVGNVAAGSPILAQECIEDYLTFDTDGVEGEHFALRVRGESMLYAGILPDDLVVVHRQQDAHNGEIVVALFEDEATVKTLRRKDGHTWLMPENPDYDPIDGTYAEIIGKVVGVVRRY